MYSGAFGLKQKEEEENGTNSKIMDPSRTCSHRKKFTEFVSKCCETRMCSAYVEVCWIHIQFSLSRIHVHIGWHVFTRIELHAFTPMNDHWIQRNLRNYKEWQQENHHLLAHKNRTRWGKNMRKMRVMTTKMRADQHRKISPNKSTAIATFRIISIEMQMPINEKMEKIAFCVACFCHQRESFHIHYELLLKTLNRNTFRLFRSAQTILIKM